jgi:hypothetical protein
MDEGWAMGDGRRMRELRTSRGFFIQAYITVRAGCRCGQTGAASEHRPRAGHLGARLTDWHN